MSGYLPILGYILIVGLVLWYAWRYSRTSIDPDWAMFNLGGFTGAVYGRDFLDCKTPMIHLWYWIITKVVGRNVKRVRFTHHVLVSLPGLFLAYITGSTAIGLAFVAMINSGFLLAFHGNVGQIPAGMIALAIAINHPIISPILLVFGLAFEPKLILSVIIMAVIYNWLPMIVILFMLGGMFFAILSVVSRDMADWLIYQNITIPKRMTNARKEFIKKDKTALISWSSVNGLVYILPITLLALYTTGINIYWLPALAYLLIIAMGLVLRQNHLIPLIGWIVVSGIPDVYLYGIVIVDLVASFFYMKDVWLIFYPALYHLNLDAEAIGKWLKEKPGNVWVNDIHSAIYIYAEKKPIHGLCEQIEIREVAEERRKIWRDRIKQEPPEYVIIGSNPGWTFDPTAGYTKEGQTRNGITIYKKQKA